MQSPAGPLALAVGRSWPEERLARRAKWRNPRDRPSKRQLVPGQHEARPQPPAADGLAHDEKPQHGTQQPPSTPCSDQIFSSRLDDAKSSITVFTQLIELISDMHLYALQHPTDNWVWAELVRWTDHLPFIVTCVRDHIRSLDVGAADRPDCFDAPRTTQVAHLKVSFTAQLREAHRAELEFIRRFREFVARQYYVVCPDATKEEVRAAQQANWGLNEGEHQTDLPADPAELGEKLLGKLYSHRLDLAGIESALREFDGLHKQTAEDLEARGFFDVDLEKGPVAVVQNMTKVGGADTAVAEKQAEERRSMWIGAGILMVFICVAVGIVVAAVIA